MDKIELDKIIADHKLWLKCRGDRRADLKGADLKGANLRGANLAAINFARADLTGANLSGANLSHTIFYDTNLTGANLSGTKLRETNFCGANLQDVNFHHANFIKTDIRFCNFTDIKGVSTFTHRGHFGMAQILGDDIMIQIGDIRETKEKWLDIYVPVFERYRYSEEDIEIFGDWIRSLA